MDLNFTGEEILEISKSVYDIFDIKRLNRKNIKSNGEKGICAYHLRKLKLEEQSAQTFRCLLFTFKRTSLPRRVDI